MGNHGGYAVGWFTLALINAGLAQSKNRSGLLWFLLSLLLGPIATFISWHSAGKCRRRIRGRRNDGRRRHGHERDQTHDG